jgi:hypothetical protein
MDSDSTDEPDRIPFRQRPLGRRLTAGMDETDEWGHAMAMELIDHIAREPTVPDWWVPAWDLGLLGYTRQLYSCCAGHEHGNCVSPALLNSRAWSRAIGR